MKSWFRQLFRFKTILIIASVGAMLSLALAYLSPYVHPKTASLLPLFGLAYWFIFLFNILLLVIWAFLRSKWVFAFLIILLVGGRLHFRVFAFGNGDENTGSNSINVMSYNVRLFDLYNADRMESYRTKNKIFKYIQDIKPDVLCFQEYYHQDAPTAFVTTDSLMQMMQFSDRHERFAQKMYGRQNFGIALFSMYPIIEKGFVNFPDQNKSFNYCIYADIVKEDTFRVYNVHLQSIRLQKDDYALFNEEGTPAAEQSSNIFRLLNKVRNAYPVRAAQAELIAQHMQNSPYPVIVCGDFNDTPLSYTYNQFSAHLTDAFRNTSFGLGKTYAGAIPAGRIDYIFHSPELGSSDFEIQNETLSDHYAISCTIFPKE